MIPEEVLEVQNSLIHTSQESEQVFRWGTEKARGAKLREVLKDCFEQHVSFHEELEKQVFLPGRRLQKSSRDSEPKGNGWKHFEDIFTGNHDLVILKECERCEFAAMKNYEYVLRKDLPLGARIMVTRQLRKIREMHARIRIEEFTVGINPVHRADLFLRHRI